MHRLIAQHGQGFIRCKTEVICSAVCAQTARDIHGNAHRIAAVGLFNYFFYILRQLPVEADAENGIHNQVESGKCFVCIFCYGVGHFCAHLCRECIIPVADIKNADCKASLRKMACNHITVAAVFAVAAKDRGFAGCIMPANVVCAALACVFHHHIKGQSLCICIVFGLSDLLGCKNEHFFNPPHKTDDFIVTFSFLFFKNHCTKTNGCAIILKNNRKKTECICNDRF